MTVLKNKSMFKKYPSITNSYQEVFIDKIKNSGYKYIPYCITEKIHGSNTQISYNCKTKEFEYAKRSGVIETGEKCYNVQDCFERIKENVYDLVQYLQPTLTKELKTVTVFGEVFGGSYPHEEVPKNNHASKVQKGVFYTNNNEWKAFDIAYTLKGDKKTYFLGAEDFFMACNAVDIDTVPLLAVVGNLDEALKYANDNSSVVYKEYGLPELENNIMEGVVIKPWKQDLWLGDTRVVLKNKNSKFKEKSRTKKVDLAAEYSENTKRALAESITYVNENRVRNVISHEGEVTEQDIGRLIGLVAKDALNDFVKDAGVWNLLEKVEQKIVTKNLQREAAKYVRKEIIGV